jgi:hypothetical protein
LKQPETMCVCVWVCVLGEGGSQGAHHKAESDVSRFRLNPRQILMYKIYQHITYSPHPPSLKINNFLKTFIWIKDIGKRRIHILISFPFLGYIS